MLNIESELNMDQNEPECAITEETITQSKRIRRAKKNSKRKARERLLSAVKEAIPAAEGSESSDILGSFQFVRTSFSQNGNQTCICGEQTEPAFWIFRF